MYVIFFQEDNMRKAQHTRETDSGIHVSVDTLHITVDGSLTAHTDHNNSPSASSEFSTIYTIIAIIYAF